MQGSVMRRGMSIVVLTVFGAQAISAGWAEEGKQENGIWGSPFQGLSISATPSRPGYSLGEQIDIRVRLKNTGQEPIDVLNSGPLKTYRVAVFYADGRPVPKSKDLVEAEAWIGKPTEPGRVSTSINRLHPGEASPGFKVITLNPWFRLDEEGTYLVVVMYNLGSWEKGFAVSNLATFRVTRGGRGEEGTRLQAP